MICDACEVAWAAAGGPACWSCGQTGRPPGWGESSLSALRAAIRPRGAT